MWAGISPSSITGTKALVSRDISRHAVPRDLDTDNVCVYEIGAFLDLGKVLAGIQAPEEDSAQFDQFLRDLGYPYVEETHNEVYKRYLRK
jgi:hypothetical protein